jgi:catalase
VLERRNDYVQARARYCTMRTGSATTSCKNMGDLLGQCERDVQERMLWHFFLVHDDYGTRVGKALGVTAKDVRSWSRSPGQVLTDEDKRACRSSAERRPHRPEGVGHVDRLGAEPPATAEEVLGGMSWPPGSSTSRTRSACRARRCRR